jgi:hypothetical protein
MSDKLQIVVAAEKKAVAETPDKLKFVGHLRKSAQRAPEMTHRERISTKSSRYAQTPK